MHLSLLLEKGAAELPTMRVSYVETHVPLLCMADVCEYVNALRVSLEHVFR